MIMIIDALLQICVFFTKMGVEPGQLFLATIAILANFQGCFSLSGMVCSTTSNQVVIQADADAFIAGFFAMHGSASNGVGCGSINTGGELYSIVLDIRNFKTSLRSSLVLVGL